MTKSNPRRCNLLTGTALLALSMAAASVPALAVVPNETTNSDEIIDTDDEFRGVGQFLRADGSVCTGTLINPRTVLFAAHCVNDRPETDYNADNFPAAFSFEVDAFPGFEDWFFNGFASNPQLGVYNINRIYYDPRSLEDALGLGFFEADIALASLDTPAVGIPTWALLFSTLPAPAAIDPVTGTRYHVNIVGYGATGNAFEGAVDGIDFRRRAAENYLGGFFSSDDEADALFGPGPETLPQNLYQLDFDSQDRDVFADVNLHRDDALPNEGTTAGGDSGGPLILDAANNSLSQEDLVIGVLSGGSILFDGQEFSSLGSTSFYQPLSLYWQYIVENNPYRYVGAAAGNGNWEDAAHWVSLLDPAYRVIDTSGTVVNGLPTTPELGPDGTEGDFGAICFELEEPGDGCIDLATGEFVDTSPTDRAIAGSVVTAQFANNRGRVALTDGTTAAPAISHERFASDIVPQETSLATLPMPSLDNGLTGATGFVPDNVDPITTGDPDIDVDPRYFDVTLSETGTTTLSSVVTIDRLTVSDAAGLAIAATGSLTSLIDINQFGGQVNVNGGVTSIGDYTLFDGMIAGTGTITAPFLTSIAGAFSPGTMGTTGTLTIDGNLVMASGTTFFVDLAAEGASDLLAVNGIANVGGTVSIANTAALEAIGIGQSYTIVTGAEGVSGAFSKVPISAILSPSFIYEDNAVLLEILAASYASVIDQDDPVQAAYAQLFDQNRSNAALEELYALDFATADTIASTFTALAPVQEQAVRSMAGQTINLLQNFNNMRLREADRNAAGGTIAVTGAPLHLLQAGLSPAGQPLGQDLMALQSGAADTTVTEASLPESFAIFLSGGAMIGDVSSLPGFAEDTEVSGFYIATGLEYFASNDTIIGLSGYFSTLDADTPLSQSADSETYAASIYARHRFESSVVIDGQFSLGSVGFDTQREVVVDGTGQTLTSSSDDLLLSAALGLSYDLETGFGTISPGIEGRFASVDLATVNEDGGTAALTIERETFKSTQTRVGFDYENQTDTVQINANAEVVFELEDGPQLLAANFAQGTGPNANFVLDTADKSWVELGISATLETGALAFGAGFDTTIGRDTADAQVFRGTATLRF